jgi:hypothetical protein
MVDLAQEISSVRAELCRADTKAATLLGLAGTAASVVAALATMGAPHLPMPARVALWSGVVLLAAAVAVLLVAVRPMLPRRGRGVGWTVWADGTSPAGRPNADRQCDQADELVSMSRLAYAKYVLIRWAVNLLLGALIVLIAAVLLGAQ